MYLYSGHIEKNSIINIRIKEKLFILREYLALKDF